MEIKKLLALLKAILPGSIKIFGENKNSNSILKKVQKSVVLVFLMSMIMFSVGTYAYLLVDSLKEVDMSYIAITLFAIMSSTMIFMQGIFISQGILFNSGDNQLLFSMPIKKSTIFASRVIKLLLSQYLWNVIIMVPTIIVYGFMENPAINFYITSICLILTLPIVPTIIAAIFGSLIQGIASKFKHKKIAQTFGMLILTMGILVFSFNLESIIGNIVKNAQSINEMITMIYYPVGIYIECILNFDVMKIIIPIVIDIVLIFVVTQLFAIPYYKVLSRLSEKNSGKKTKIKNSKTKGVIMALFIKEFKRYTSSPIYMMNTLFAPLMLIIGSIYAMVSPNQLIDLVSSEYGDISGFISKAYMIFVLFVVSIMSTTAVSISLEGKNLWILKSLPIDEKKIFISKILLNLIIMVPFTVIATIIFAITYKFSLLDTIFGIVVSTVVPLLISILGLIINLKYPKLEFRSDTEVVKRSTSTLVSIYIGMIIAIAPVILYFVLDTVNIDLYTGIVISLYGVITIVLWRILMTYGVKKFRKLSN